MPAPRGPSRDEPAASPIARRADRLGDAAERSTLRPSSLVGSFFHGGPTGPGKGAQGCVVAEPAPQVYLVEYFGWLAGGSLHQSLVHLADMNDWQFYDTAEWMNNTYSIGGHPKWGDDGEGQRDA